MFPNFNYLVPECFGKEASQTVMGVQMACSYVGILLGPLLCGLLGQNIGMYIFPIYVSVAFVFMASITLWAKKRLARKT
jgi:predicted MFS family arabinose efflux permease